MYYPREELRTMGDIDFFIHPEDMAKVHLIMEQEGAEFLYEESDEHNEAFRIKKANVEIHSKISYKESILNRFNFEQYFSDAFAHTSIIEGDIRVFTPEYNMIYTLFHAAKHFYKVGCGVRMITDIALMIKNGMDIIDWKYVDRELKHTKLKEFSGKIFWLCDRWFKVKAPLEMIPIADAKIVEQYILDGGTFGHSVMDGDSASLEKRKGNFFVSLIRWAFPSYREMKNHSSWFKDKPAILLPAAYIERFFRNAKERGGVINWLKNLSNSKDRISKHDSILNIMGLK